MSQEHIYKPGKGGMEQAEGQPGSDGSDEKYLRFPLQHLPPVAREMAEATARVARTPEALAGCCALGIMSAATGAGLQVPSHPSKLARPNLYLLVGMKSGTGKTETLRPVAEPFFAYERDMVEKWKAETLPGLQAEAEMLEGEIAKLKKDAFGGKSGKSKSGKDRTEIRRELGDKKKALAEANAGLMPPRLCCEDVTSQQLAAMLQSNQEQLASVSSDAGNIVNILLGQYSKLDRTDDNIYVKAWSGDNCRVDRKGSGPVLLQRPCLAALWLVQPDKIETLLAERSLIDGGLIPRPLMCQPNAQHQPIVRGLEGIPVATINAWAMLVGKLIKTFRKASEPRTIEATPEAIKLMDAHCNRIVERMNTDLQDVDIYAARWNEQAWRIALCLHAGLHADKAGGERLAAETAESAIAIADWFAGEQLRILARGRHAARRAKRDEVLQLLADKPEGITARDVQLKRIVPIAEEARALLAQMEGDDELTHTESKPEGGGHVMLIYTKSRKKK